MYDTKFGSRDKRGNWKPSSLWSYGPLFDIPTKHWNNRVHAQYRPVIDKRENASLHSLGFLYGLLTPSSGIFRGYGNLVSLTEASRLFISLCKFLVSFFTAETNNKPHTKSVANKEYFFTELYLFFLGRVFTHLS